jgi:hypothetical protein
MGVSGVITAGLNVTPTNAIATFAGNLECPGYFAIHLPRNWSERNSYQIGGAKTTKDDAGSQGSTCPGASRVISTPLWAPADDALALV